MITARPSSVAISTKTPPSPATRSPPGAAGDIFLAAFDAKGSLTWVEQAGGKLNDNAYPITFRAPDELIIAGACAAPATFGSHEVPQSGASDLYAAKWKLKAK